MFQLLIMNQVNKSILEEMTNELSSLSKEYIFNLAQQDDVLSSTQMEFFDHLIDCFALYDNYVIVTGNLDNHPYNLSLNELVEFFDINLEYLIQIANTDIFNELNT